MSHRTGKQPRNIVKLTTVSGRGVLPGVDLDDSAALLAHLERLSADRLQETDRKPDSRIADADVESLPVKAWGLTPFPAPRVVSVPV